MDSHGSHLPLPPHHHANPCARALPEPHGRIHVESVGSEDILLQKQRSRAIVLLLLVIAVASLASLPPVHRGVQRVIDQTEQAIADHALAGAILFVVLSACSAMVVFFSTAVVTPVAIDAFGTLATVLLLWLGWVLGGMTAYAIGRFLGRPVAHWFIEPRHLQVYEERAARLTRFAHVLLFQFAIPSEIPGYVLGLAGCPFGTYVAAMAIAELPFAIGAVFLGEGFLEGRSLLILSVGAAGIALTWFAFHRLASVWRNQPLETHKAA